MESSTSALSSLQEFVKEGYHFKGSVGWGVLFFLTVCPGIGQLGLNHIMVDQPVVAMLKVISLPISFLLMILLIPYLPLAIQGQWLFVVAGLGPWYIFDMLQSVFNYSIGYRSFIDVPLIPLGGTQSGKKDTTIGGGNNGNWNLTASKMNLLFASIAGCGQLVSYIFPKSGLAGTIITGIGGGLFALSGVASTYAAYNASPLSAALPLAGGGGGRNSLPPLSEILDKIPTPQSGGARSAESKESAAFLQGLGFIAVAGITLGLLRSKQ